jgi:hypothetical protein
MIPVTKKTLAQRFNDFMLNAKNFKIYLKEGIAVMKDNNISSNQILNLMSEVSGIAGNLASLRADPNVNAYALEQLYVDPDSGYNFIEESDDLLDAMQGLIDWVANNFPKNEDGYILKDRIINGDIQVRAWTPQETTDLVATMNVIIDILD